MFGFEKESKTNQVIFRVGKSSLFAKTELLPKEFGMELLRLSFTFGIEQANQYLASQTANETDAYLKAKVAKNPGFFQLMFVNLLAGAFYCYVHSGLRASNDVLDEVRSGVLTRFLETMSGISESVINEQLIYIGNFSIVLEREMRQVEENASLKLFLQYIYDFYFDDQPNGLPLPAALIERVTGLGSRFAAICQNDWRLSLQQ